MAITIDATVGGASANSFVTEAEQIAYMATRLNASAWTTVSGPTCTDNEKKAMVEATRELSDLNDWKGNRVTTTQALSWPRDFVIDPDSPNRWFYANTVIPTRIKEATYELAFQFLKAGATDLAAADPNSGVIREKVGPLETEWQSGSSRPQGLSQFTRFIKRIAPLRCSLGPNQFMVVRG